MSAARHWTLTHESRPDLGPEIHPGEVVTVVEVSDHAWVCARCRQTANGPRRAACGTCGVSRDGNEMDLGDTLVGQLANGLSGREWELEGADASIVGTHVRGPILKPGEVVTAIEVIPRPDPVYVWCCERCATRADHHLADPEEDPYCVPCHVCGGKVVPTLFVPRTVA